MHTHKLPDQTQPQRQRTTRVGDARVSRLPALRPLVVHVVGVALPLLLEVCLFFVTECWRLRGDPTGLEARREEAELLEALQAKYTRDAAEMRLRCGRGAAEARREEAELLEALQTAATSYKLQATSHKLQATSDELHATHYKLQATSHKATSYKLQAYKLQATR